MVRTTLIIIQVTIGKKKVEFPDLKIISPGNCPSPSLFMYVYKSPITSITIPKIIKSFCITILLSNILLHRLELN